MTGPDAAARPKILILGARGRLGAALEREYAREADVIACGRHEADLTKPEHAAAAVTAAEPDIVINCAAMTNVDECESARDLAETVNSRAPAAIAQACSQIGARMIHISTDYVFSGEATTPYAEEAATGPISWYGETKLAGDEGVLGASDHHAVVRVAWVFGPDRDSFIDKALQLSLRGEPVRAVADKIGSPTYTLDAAAALRALFAPTVPGGVYHLCNRGACTWRDWAQQAIDAATAIGAPVKTREVEPLKLADIKAMVARRPVYTAMTCERIEALIGAPLRAWQEAVGDYVRLLRDLGRLPDAA